jgi:predicted GIY-YIG superfamily endonuclease
VNEQRYVYVLLRTIHQKRYYTGLTSNVEARLAAHNEGLSKHTASGRLWKLVTTIEFLDADRAQAFVIYLKSVQGARLRDDIFDNSSSMSRRFTQHHVTTWVVLNRQIHALD